MEKGKSVLCITFKLKLQFCTCRLSYAVYLIDLILKKHSTSDIYIMYDIACTLQKHLKVSVVFLVMK